MWKNLGGATNSSKTLLVTVGVVFLSVAVGAAASSSMIRKRKKRTNENDDKKKASVKKNDTSSQSPSATTPSLPARDCVGNDNAMFLASANNIKNLNSGALANAEKLQLYSLFKQATVGNAPKWFSPSSYDLLTEQAKHHAWSQLRGMAQPEATQAYIKVAQSLLLQVAQNGRRQNNDDCDDDDDESIDHDALSDDEVDYSKPQPVVSNKTTNTNPTEPDGFGVGVSRPVVEPEEEEEEDSDSASKPPHVALLQASSKNNVATIQRLVDATAPGTDERSRLVDHTDDMGQTALHLAADAGHDDAVRCLIRAGANVAAADQDGISVLQAAVIAGKVETSRILWQEGHADPDQADHDGDTPRHCAQDDGSFAMKRLFEGIPVAIKEDSALNVSSYSASADTIDEEEEDDDDLETQDTEAETATESTPEQQQRKQQARGKDGTDKRLIVV